MALPCRNGDWLVTVPKSALEQRIGCLSAAKRRQLNQALAFALGLDE
jgi:mRNA-degrading endonuclease toxin of MazEF toxin-antitoxin module